MANMQKYTAGSVGGLERHYVRWKDKDGNYQRFGNQDIDISKTHLNYNLAPQLHGSHMDFIKERCSQVDFVGRKNTNVMVSWIVTAPEGLASSIEYRANQRPLLKFDGEEVEKNLRLFFEESYNFLNQRYGGSEGREDVNIISSYVHMDETTPHMHYAFVPVTFDEQRGREKVSAKEVVNRRDLQTFHKDLERYMTRVFGREIGILNEATKDGNKSIEELKQGSAQAELSKIQNNTSNLRLERNELQDEVLYLGGKKNELEGQISAVEGDIKFKKDELAEIENLVESKTRTKKGINYLIS